VIVSVVKTWYKLCGFNVIYSGLVLSLYKIQTLLGVKSSLEQNYDRCVSRNVIRNRQKVGIRFYTLCHLREKRSWNGKSKSWENIYSEKFKVSKCCEISSSRNKWVNNMLHIKKTYNIFWIFTERYFFCYIYMYTDGNTPFCYIYMYTDGTTPFPRRQTNMM
jgi:hypothetical protein